MRYSFVLAGLLAMLLISSPTSGQFHAKDWDLSIGGSGNNSKDFDAGSFNINGSLGYFVSDGVELAIRQTVGYADANSGTFWNGSTRGAIDFHFNYGKFVPFLGANIGYVYGDGVTDTWEAAPEAGLKWFANDTTYLFGQVEYQFFFNSSDTIGDAFDDGQFVYTLGMGLRL